MSVSDLTQSDLTGGAAVLLFFKMNGCGHCQQAWPDFQRAAAALSKWKGVKLTTLTINDQNPQKAGWAQAVANEIIPKMSNGHVEVKGYPTFLLFIGPPGKKQVLQYHGARDAASLIKFVETGQQR